MKTELVATDDDVTTIRLSCRAQKYNNLIHLYAHWFLYKKNPDNRVSGATIRVSDQVDRRTSLKGQLIYLGLFTHSIEAHLAQRMETVLCKYVAMGYQ